MTGQRRAVRGELLIDLVGSKVILKSGASSRATSSSLSPSSIPRSAVSRSSNHHGGGNVGARFPAGTALVAAQRILVLAIDLLSFDMMSNVMKDSLDRVEVYVFFPHFLHFIY